LSACGIRDNSKISLTFQNIGSMNVFAKALTDDTVGLDMNPDNAIFDLK
jgi:hypothetical protein